MLEAIQQSYGPSAPAKLLFTIFGQRAEKYQAVSAGAHLADRAAALTKVRSSEGYMAELENDEARDNPAQPSPPEPTAVDDQQSLPWETSNAQAQQQPPPQASRPSGFRVVPIAKAPEPAAFSSPIDGAATRSSLRIVEHHSPLEDLLRRFPIIARLERELFERVLKCRVQREEQCEPGIYRCVFHLAKL